jgi:hypothetical protein
MHANEVKGDAGIEGKQRWNLAPTLIVAYTNIPPTFRVAASGQLIPQQAGTADVPERQATLP